MIGTPLRSGGAAAFLLALAFTATAAPPHTQLLPATTKEYVSAPQIPKITEPWDQTSFAKMLKEPALKELADQIFARFNADSDMQRRLGFGWDDVRAVGAGEGSWAFIYPGPDKHAAVVLLDVTGKVDVATKRFADALEKRKVQGKVQDLGNLTSTVYELNGRKVYHLVKDDTFIAVDDLEVLQGILARWAGNSKDSLDALPAFRGVFKNLPDDKNPVHLRWFIEPFGRADALRATRPKPAPTPPDQPAQAPPTDWLTLLRTQGFDSVQGVGGVIAFNVGDNDLLTRLAVFAPPPSAKAPYPKAMGMLAFDPLAKPAPQAWVPDQLASSMSSYITAGGDLPQAFTAYGFLVDAIRRRPRWFETYLDTYRDQYGVDVRKDVIGQFGRRVSLLNDYKTPAGAKSERQLLAFELNPGATKVVAEAVRKMLEPEVPDRVKKHEAAGVVVWEFLPNTAGQEPSRPSPVAVNAVAVWKDHLIIGSSLDLVVDFLKNGAEGKRLADAGDYKRVHQAIEAMGGKSSSLRMFARLESDFTIPYELLRSNKFGESTALSARLFGMLMGLDRRDPEKNRFDGTKLPEFKQVAHHLGTLGAFVVNKDDGWVATGFVLKK